MQVHGLRCQQSGAPGFKGKGLGCGSLPSHHSCIYVCIIRLCSTYISFDAKVNKLRGSGLQCFEGSGDAYFITSAALEQIGYTRIFERIGKTTQENVPNRSVHNDDSNRSPI